MKAYAILAGGGVKGAALVGALSAATENEIKFMGYGGVSAGAIVALLSVVGFSDEDLREEIVDLEFNTVLDDNGVKLTKIRKILKENRLQKGLCEIKLGWRLRNIMKAISPYQDEFGIYSGEQLITYLEKLVQKEKPDFTKETTFLQLAEMKTPSLRIVASNINEKEAVIFSADTTPNYSVLLAVRASVGYPFVFKPHTRGEHSLVDGGLASNAPSFLFEDKYKESGMPSIMFDLVSEPDPGNNQVKDKSLLDYGFELLSTALDSSDRLIRDIGRGIYTVDVLVPHDIKTWDMHITQIQRNLLFLNGYQSANKSLSSIDKIKNLRNAGDALQRQNIARYGDADIYDTILAAIANDIEYGTKAEKNKTRVCLFFPTDRDSLMVTYGAGFKHCPDIDLELGVGEGVTWQAWEGEKDKLWVYDLDVIRVDPDFEFPLSANNRTRVEKKRKSLIAVRIGSASDNGGEPIAVLGIDSETKFEETGWTADKGDTIDFIVGGWIRVLRKIIEASRI